MKVEVNREDITVLKYLQQEGIAVNSPCAGAGRCGKCRVKVNKVHAPISEADRRFFNQNQLQEGNRLACKLQAVKGMEIEVEESSQVFNILTEYSEDENIKVSSHVRVKEALLDQKGETYGILDAINASSNQALKYSSKALQGLNKLKVADAGRLFYTLDMAGKVYSISEKKPKLYGLAIDIGTTTIAMELVDLESGVTKDIYSCMNTQGKYGADVISRINHSNEHGVKKLTGCVRRDILEGIRHFGDTQNIMVEHINHIVISGNTTMLHMLLGLDCKSIGEYPFTPLVLEQLQLEVEEVLQVEGLTGKLTILPSLSSYVGADIVSGLLKCEMGNQESINLFIDIGTNGEMALGNKERLYALATAAGPAFEGGNISCGTGSISGAINSACYKEGRFEVTTISDEKAIGVCGSGLMDIIACALKEELLDETGMVEEDEIEIADGIVLTQEDIRQVQLAKAAIRAGIEVLIREYGARVEEIENVYLAGGFGQFMSIKSVVAIGLMPEELQGKVQRVGNSSLAGAKRYMLDRELEQTLLTIRKVTQTLNLGSNALFNQLFMENMMFESGGILDE